MELTPAVWEEINVLFHSALRHEPDARLPFLEANCSDPTVRREVLKLISNHDNMGPFLSESSIGEIAAKQKGEEPYLGGWMIDRYHLIKLIGRGGMGEVWLAEQLTPVQRTVALKLIKSGMDTREVVARFEAERQALALMEHPAIARVFDAGSSAEGRPYFVMEHVTGLPMTAYCDQHHLSLQNRLELFVKACEGVQHAHQKAVIHRDLKPSNILVTQVDGNPMPKIIDFGVAKALSGQIGPEVGFTLAGSIVGTPEYMSPEQADSAGADVDTRTDVYSLGVILYELLVGALPLAFERVPWDKFLEKLREDDIPRPSSRLRTLGEQATAISEKRATNARTLYRQLHGDLDCIVLKALEKDRSSRYGSPSDLVGDLVHYLRNEPVKAHPISLKYRTGKYLRRHGIVAAFAMTGFLVLSSFFALEAFNLHRISLERDRAENARDRADRIANFMTGIFRISSPSEARGNTVTAREILDKASKDITSGLKNDRQLQAQMMYVMADVYDNLGLYTRADSLLHSSLEIDRSVNLNDPASLKALSLLSWVLCEEGRYPEAEKLQRQTLNSQERILGAKHLDTLASMHQLGDILSYEGKYPEAAKLLGITLDARRAVLGPEQRETIATESDLARVFELEGDYKNAEQLQRQTLEIRGRILGPEHPDTLMSMNNLAGTLADEGRNSEAETLLRKTVDMDARILGPEHPETLMSMTNLGITLNQLHRYAEAEKLQKEVLGIRRRVLGPEHPDTLMPMNSLADTLSKEGHYNEAEKLLRETLAIQTRVLGPEHPDTALSVYNLGSLAALKGDKKTALLFLNRSIDHGAAPWLDLAIATDPDLKLLHGDREFVALVARAKEKAATAQKTK